MGAPYHQFCPVSKAMELLDERWTLLVVRELLMGSAHFNDLRRGLPKMSPSLLSKRLQHLVRAGVVTRSVDGDDVQYRLTDAGNELRPVVEALGSWGIRWIPQLADRDLDPKLLLWDMHRNVDHSRVPPVRSVVAFTFTDVAPALRHWWIVINAAEADVCDVDPGYAVTVHITTTLRCLTEIWRGDIAWSAAARGGALHLDGVREYCRDVPHWFYLSGFAVVPRPA